MADLMADWNKMKGTAIAPPERDILKQPEISGNLFQRAQQGAGYGLTKTVAGISAIGQGVLGFLNTLATDSSAYDKLYKYDEKTGNVNFQWDQIGAVGQNAINGGLAQAQRTLSSNNLTEFGQNAATGAQLLKNLPGKAGEAFSVDDARTRIGTGVAGFLLELALDPVGKVAKVAKAGESGLQAVDTAASALSGRKGLSSALMNSTVVGSTGIRSKIGQAIGAESFSLHGIAGAGTQAAVTSVARALRMSDASVYKAGDIARRIGGDLATGNIVAGPVVLGAREASLGIKTALFNVAQDGTRGSNAQKAAALLEFAYGPLASATDAGRRLLTKYIGLSEELPRTIAAAADLQQTMMARIPPKQRAYADKVFKDFVGAQDQLTETRAFQRLSDLGVDGDLAHGAKQLYVQGNARNIDVLMNSNADVAFSPHSLRYTYRMTLGGRVARDQMDYLTDMNTPASWQIRQGGVRERLQSFFNGGAILRDASNDAGKFTIPNASNIDNFMASTNKTMGAGNSANTTVGYNIQAAINAAGGKVTPLQFIENKTLGGVDMAAAQKFGIKVQTPKAFAPSTVANNGLTEGAVDVGKTGQNKTNAFDISVKKTQAESMFSGEKLPAGFQRVTIHNTTDIENAKQVFADYRKNAITYGNELPDAIPQMAVNQNGHLVIQNSDGTMGGIFVKNSDDSGVHIVHDEGGEYSLKEAAGELDKDNGFYHFQKGEKFSDKGEIYDNYTQQIDEFGEPVIGTSSITKPTFGINSPGGVRVSSLPRSTNADLNKRVPGVQQKAPNVYVPPAAPKSMFNTAAFDPDVDASGFYAGRGERIAKTAVTPMTEAEIKGWADLNGTTWHENLPADLRESVRIYKGSEYKEMNAIARNEYAAMADINPAKFVEYQRHIKNVDAALASSPLQAPLSAFKGIGTYDQRYIDLREAFDQGRLIGSSVTDNGFVSTSYSKTSAQSFISQSEALIQAGHGRGTMITFEMPAGTKAGFIDYHGKMADGKALHGSEREILLGRGNVITYTDAYLQGEFLHVRAVVSPPNSVPRLAVNKSKDAFGRAANPTLKKDYSPRGPADYLNPPKAGSASASTSGNDNFDQLVYDPYGENTNFLPKEDIDAKFFGPAGGGVSKAPELPRTGPAVTASKDSAQFRAPDAGIGAPANRAQAVPAELIGRSVPGSAKGVAVREGEQVGTSNPGYDLRMSDSSKTTNTGKQMPRPKASQMPLDRAGLTSGTAPKGTAAPAGRNDFGPRIGLPSGQSSPFGKLSNSGAYGVQAPVDTLYLPDALQTKFMDDLANHLDGATTTDAAGNNVIGKLHESVSEVNAAGERVSGKDLFMEKTAQVKDRTVADLLEYAKKWGADHNLPEATAGKLGAALGQSLIYVPGSREFVAGVKHIQQTEFSTEMQAAFGDAFNSVPGPKGEVVRERVLDPAFYGLYGKIESFAVQAADQGAEVGKLAAQRYLWENAKREGILQSDPFPGAIPLRTQMNASDAALINAQDLMEKDWWISPGNLHAIKAANSSMEGFTGENLAAQGGRVLQRFSNLFRSAALKTDPSAHVTQMLGNLAMMTHMGYGPLFEDARQLVPGMKRAFQSVMLMNGQYDDMVNSGLQIAMTPLSEGQRLRVAEGILRREQRLGTVENPRDALHKIHTTFMDVMNYVPDGFSNLGRNIQGNVIGGATRVLNGSKQEGLTSAGDVANVVRGMSAGHILSMHDMLTRAYVWDQAVRNGSKELLTGNPWAATLGVWKNGRFDTETLNNLIKSVSDNTTGKAIDLKGQTLDDLQNLSDQISRVKQQAAEVGNEVALNYHDVPRAVQFLTRTGVVPFIKFQYKATGRIMEWADEKPWQFAPYYTAQRNANEALAPEPEQFQQQMASLPQNVRDALVIPTGTTDRLGRNEFVDLSRWVPFGMFARPAGGSTQADGSAVPNQLLTMPLLESMYTLYTGKDTQGFEAIAPGQSKIAAAAQLFALNFSPSGVGPGGRRASQLANAMEQSRFSYDEDGKPVFSNPAMNAVKWYGELPARMGAEVDHAIGGTGAALGASADPTQERPWTTPDQAVLRGFVPGATFSADLPKAADQISGAFDNRIQGEQTKYNSLMNNAQLSTDPGQYTGALQASADAIIKLQEAKNKALLRYTVGQ